MTDVAWRPSATPETLKARAELFSSVRAFFAARGVMEVDTPMRSRHATVDRHIDSLALADGAHWLHTSPEFAMKRLLAAGSGPIFQICHVFRDEPAARLHNPEFTLLEWYRPGYDDQALMDEVEVLVRTVAGSMTLFGRSSYREVFLREAGFDPLTTPRALVRERAIGEQLVPASYAANDDGSDPNFWLDLWMSLRVSERLGGLDRPEFVYDYPASQAMLARLKPGEPPVAARFELFWKGVELANGYHELSDATEQKRRFKEEQSARWQLRKPVPPFDAPLVAALEHGLPDCAGVALGLDRLLMLKLGLPSVGATMPFDSDRA